MTRYGLVFALGVAPGASSEPSGWAGRLEVQLARLDCHFWARLDPQRSTWVTRPERYLSGPASLAAATGLDPTWVEQFHALLDQLPSPAQGPLYLDIIWLTTRLRSPAELDSHLLSFFTRAVFWSQARVLVLSCQPDSTPQVYLDRLRAERLDLSQLAHLAEFVPPRVLWRGWLTWSDGPAERALPGFELLARTSQDALAFDRLLLSGARRRAGPTPDPRRLSVHLKVLGRVSLAQLPGNLPLSPGLILRTAVLASDRLTRSFLAGASFGPSSGLVARLFYSRDEASSTASSERHPHGTLAEFKQALADRRVKRDLDEGLGKTVESLLLLILHSDLQGPDSASSACIHRHCIDRVTHVIRDSDLWNFHTHFHSDRLVHRPETSSTLAQILNNHSGSGSLSDPVSIHPTPGEWEEKRLLACLEAQATAPTSGGLMTNHQTMCPAEDFVLMEAGELLKLFNPDGSAKRTCLEVLKPKKKLLLSAQSPQDLPEWPLVRFQDYFGLHYNVSEASEDQDRNMAKFIRTFVGAKETLSTCHSDIHPESATLLIRPSRTKKALKKTPKKRPLAAGGGGELKRRSTREGYPINSSRPLVAHKSTTSRVKTPVELFKKKLRVAVYEVLHEKGLTEKHRLFRPCFRKLFQVVEVFTKSMSSAKMSTETLKIIANNNAELVIQMQKGTLTPAQEPT